RRWRAISARSPGAAVVSKRWAGSTCFPTPTTSKRSRGWLAMADRRSHPDHETTGWPPGVPYIIGNEGCERFSFYGMGSILYVYTVQLYRHSPAFASRPEDFATAH